jgi:gamma-D-glutamyl-L-lysine dipeptidyl-peptidase
MPMRKEPFHVSEQVNEVLFGERIEILDINDRDWALIRCEWDGYEGWCKTGQLTLVSKKDYVRAAKYITTHSNAKLLFEEGEVWLPAGAELTGMKSSRISIYDKPGKLKGKKHLIKSLELNADLLLKYALQYLGTSYIWGGRSTRGIDCSGLSQIAYKLCGKSIPRDADQQAMEGETVDFLQQARCGDLAFFDNADGKIVHVGLLIDAQTILHATDTSGRVVIDRIDPSGIISRNLKKRTHNLRLIKRYF